MLRIIVTLSIAFVVALGCASTSTEEPVVETPVAKPAPPPPPPPPPRPEPKPEPVAAPVRELPKTAGPLPAVGLAGLAAIGLAGGLRLVRRRL